MLQLIPKNLGTRDRVIRLSIAVGLALLAIWLQSWILVLITLFVLFEGLYGWCVVFQLLGKNSCPVPQEKSQQQMTPQS